MKARYYYYYDESEPADTPAISVTPGSWNAGSTPVGTPVSQIFTIENTGSGTLNITLPITMPDGFTVTVDPDESVAPGDFTTFTVQATAASEAVFSGNISITSNAASSPSLIPVEVNVINAIFANLTRAWPLTENTANVMLRDA